MRHRLDSRGLLALFSALLLTLSLACSGPDAAAEGGEDGEAAAEKQADSADEAG